MSGQLSQDVLLCDVSFGTARDIPVQLRGFQILHYRISGAIDAINKSSLGGGDKY